VSRLERRRGPPWLAASRGCRTRLPRTRLGIGLAGAAVAMVVAGVVAGLALWPTLNAWLPSAPRLAKLTLGAAGSAAPSRGGAQGQGTLWPMSSDATGQPGGRTTSRIPVPGAQDRRQREVRTDPGVLGPEVPSVVPPTSDPADAWNTAVLRPWRLPPGPFSAAGGGSSGSRGAPRLVVPVELFIEYNATDGEASLQAFFDGPAWTRVRVVGPAGRTIVETRDPSGVLGVVDLTELMSESPDPTLTQLLKMFPPGDYSFRGTALGGDPFEGKGRLSYDLPDPVVIIAIDPTVPVIIWTWAPRRRSPIQELASVQVVLENARGIAMGFDLHPSTTSFVVPAEFLEPGTAYQVDVVAIAANGNRTVTESAFVTPGHPSDIRLGAL
jgi:hypothetical protein